MRGTPFVTSKVSRVATRLQGRIEGAGLPIGASLGTKSALASEFDVAVATLNESLRLLQERGYVTLRSGRRGGVFVGEAVGRLAMSHALLLVSSDSDELRDAFQVQDALQLAVATHAAQHCSARDAERISQALHELRGHTDGRDSLRAMWNVDRAIAKASVNRLLMRSYEGALDVMLPLIAGVTVPLPGLEPSIQVHERMAAAVMNRDPIAAARAALDHSPPSL